MDDKSFRLLVVWHKEIHSQWRNVVAVLVMHVGRFVYRTVIVYIFVCSVEHVKNCGHIECFLAFVHLIVH